MSTARVRTLPFYLALARHLRDPVKALEQAGSAAGGELVRLNLGPFRPFLATHPDHVQHVLRTSQPNYLREGMFWDPMIPLFGDGILADGEAWRESRKVLLPLFTARRVESLAGRMAEIIAERIEATVRPGERFDAVEKMSAIVHPTIIRLFFGDQISAEDIARLLPAYDTAVTSKALRLALPFVPESVPLPGDRAFRRSVAAINEVVYPRVREARARLQGADDVVGALVKAWDDDGKIRDNVVSMHGAATETTATALTWVWPTLEAHPELAGAVFEEIDRVVGKGPVRAEHLAGLVRLKSFLSELLRLYPVGWILPRRTVSDETVGGVTVTAGSTVIISPYLTHRLPEFWERPLEFDPSRFEGQTRRHRFAYFPFGGGPHQCVGQHLFMIEAQLLLAGILSRYRPVLHTRLPVTALPSFSLRTRQRVDLTLVAR
ncbi:cytochrome P450 [Nonomuraea africana]|uniref:Cytochrome P450 n=1 Tax=Nonomuraea africana TaxID=46171 RepID=A0ABR9KF06_9ACTN|nr:cytochrome P450 [Nonomuraea africana]MBE1560598.1 cytochrome P450 [Nonomuraea africana]